MRPGRGEGPNFTAGSCESGSCRTNKFREAGDSVLETEEVTSVEKLRLSVEQTADKIDIVMKTEIKKAMNLLIATALMLLVAMTSINGAGIKDDSFAPFWAQFKTAVASKNKEAIAGMTKFPFTYNSDILAKADFMKKCDAIFSAKVQKCFLNAKPVKADDRDSYSVFCGQTLFVFEKGAGGYQFTDVGEND